jgi:ligand-binding SRPBCC domain-containing protein
MNTFEHHFVVAAPLSAVAAFHQDSRALRLLTPPPILVQFQRIEPLAEGSIAEFTLWAGPLPIRWQARHDQVDPQRGFRDIQVRGPFASWTHEHRFEVVDASHTAVIDRVTAQPSRHPGWGLISRMMWLNLPLLFAYRGWRTRKALEARQP